MENGARIAVSDMALPSRAHSKITLLWSLRGGFARVVVAGPLAGFVANRGAETVLEQCGGPPDSKGSAYSGGRSARAREGAFKRISVAGKGLRARWQLARAVKHEVT